MKRIKGSFTYFVADKEYSLYLDDVIHVYKDKEGKVKFDEILTEDNVEIAIKSEMKSRGLKGCLHDIKLYLDNGICIAQAENFSKPSKNLKFLKDKLDI